MQKKRLAKYLASCGIASRRKCEELIFSGKVKVNGIVTLVPETLVDKTDQIEYQGKKVYGTEKKVYFLLNKPKGYICSSTKKEGVKFVLDLFKEINARLFTVGRLDRDTTGLLIVTNDGHFANRVIHPSSGLNKEYIVKTDQEITDTHLKCIAAGMEIEEHFVRPVKVKKIRRATVKVVVSEGKKREVRQLVKNAGLKPLALKRSRIGGLRLGNLPIGSYRALTEKERMSIFQ